MKRPRAVTATLLLASVSALVALVLAELILPWLLDLEKVTLTYDPLLGFKGRSRVKTIWKREMGDHPRTVVTNQHGFHDVERHLEKAPGVHRIVFLGDSFLEAYQVPVEENFSQLLAARLGTRAGEAVGLGIESLNQGVHGYGLGVHYLSVRERLAAWHPDSVVLVLFLGNDLHDNFGPVAASAVPQFRARGDTLQYEPAPPYEWTMWLRDHVLARSAFMRLFWMHVVKENEGIKSFARAMGMVSTPEIPPETDPAGDEEMLKVAQLQLAAIAEFLSARRIPLVVYAIPDPFRVREVMENETVSKHSAAEEVVLSTLAQHGVPCVYPRDLFADRTAAGEAMYRNGYGHFTQAAHALSARLLEPLLWHYALGAGTPSDTGDEIDTGLD